MGNVGFVFHNCCIVRKILVWELSFIQSLKQEIGVLGICLYIQMVWPFISDLLDFWWVFNFKTVDFQSKTKTKNKWLMKVKVDANYGSCLTLINQLLINFICTLWQSLRPKYRHPLINVSGKKKSLILITYFSLLNYHDQIESILFWDWKMKYSLRCQLYG